MKKIKNIAEVVPTLGFPLRGKEWTVEVALDIKSKSDWGTKCNLYIIDETHYRIEDGYKNVFGVTIDYKAEQIRLCVIPKGSGWGPTNQWIVATGDKYKEYIATKDVFIHHIKEHMNTPEVWFTYAVKWYK